MYMSHPGNPNFLPGAAPSMGDYGGGTEAYNFDSDGSRSCDTCARYNHKCRNTNELSTACDTCRGAGWPCVYSPRKPKPTKYAMMSGPESEASTYTYIPYQSLHPAQQAQAQAQAQAQGAASPYALTHQLYNYNSTPRYLNPHVFFPPSSTLTPLSSPYYPQPPATKPTPAPAPAPAARYPTPAAPLAYANNFSYFDYVAESEAMTDVQRAGHREHLSWLLRALEEGEINAHHRLHAG